jgi:predicted metal-dependent phosphoesterase TrpH
LKLYSGCYEADLHTHTTASDGELTPAALVRRAVERGVRLLAVTDHDTLSGLAEAAAEAATAGAEFWPGVEINTSWRGREIHVLGYLSATSRPRLEERLSAARSLRHDRAARIINKLNSLEVNLTLADVQRETTGAAPYRSHIAKALCRAGYAADVADAFKRWIGRNAPAFVPHHRLRPEEAIAWIREDGGIPVIAHPGDADLSAAEIARWVSCGLRGLEARHPHHNDEQTTEYLCLARALGLVITGGSDFHGPAVRAGVEPGCCGLSLAEAKLLRS